ncbi:protein DpdH [Anaeromyxobacter paludicola]|uniref:ATP-binding protein n=1 Tax=Anaeromyxobacter paludicola TaxID=2918171 RepID=A0ABN6N8P7_9BACT|nr:protein DpdH [Anaeromyxobacter paludicola]BDG08613.1 hypothetical protein AMPC_17260 [Anaeromyxobacter paludicola]
MSPLKDSVTPSAICWDPSSRSEVMDTIALNVPDPVFRATHSPSFIQQQGARAGAFVSLSEATFLSDFLDAKHNHVFDIAVGDNGTGKSHFIKWLYLEIQKRIRDEQAPYWLVLVPRSSSNLADVVARVLAGFHGEIVTRLSEELKKHHKLDLGQAKNRVIDELAYVLELPETPRPGDGLESEEESLVRTGLPALVRDQALRAVLISRDDGVVTRVARHVLGQRERAGDDDELRWKPDDFLFTAAQAERSGGDARELSYLLRDDERLRGIAATLVNRSQPQALRQLLRFKSGDMKAALTEIRQELLVRGKELVLLIEDLSITEGLDAELVEALQIRTIDSGTTLCRLRSIVGVTNDDYARMRENIAEGRTHRTVFFNMPVGGNEGRGVTRRDLDAFASRYLNASRYAKAELESWSASASGGELPSACDECSARIHCHKNFGEVDGRGLFPFTAASVSRLYDQVASSRSRADRAFNPRILVGRVLNGVMEEAEQSLRSGTYPRGTLLDSFGLHNVRSDVELELQSFGEEASRLRRAIELYSPDPSSPQPFFSSGISAALGLPVLSWKASAPPKGPSGPSPTSSGKTGSGSQEGTRGRETEKQTATPSLDLFDRWRQGEALPDADLNRWRSAVHSAVCGWIDWDGDGIAHAYSRFKNVGIYFEGQFTQRGRTDVPLEIGRSPETALTLRALVNGLDRDPAKAEKQLVLVRRSVETWATVVTDQIRRLISHSGTPSPLQLAAHTLALGALVRGLVRPDSKPEDHIAAALTPWPEEKDRPSKRSSAWMALWDAFSNHHEAVLELVTQAIACTKGRRAGSFIDSSRIQDAIAAAFQTGVPLSAPPEASAWSYWKDIRELATSVSNTFASAVASERAYAEGLRAELSASLGSSDVKTVAVQVQQAVHAALAADILRSGGAPNVKNEDLERWTAQSGAPRIREVENVSGSSPPSVLYALARLDRPYFEDLSRFLDTATTVCKASLQYAEGRMKEIGQGTDPETLEAEVLALVESIGADLESLAEGS